MKMMLQPVVEDPHPPDAEKIMGKFPKKAILLSPHSNENPTTLSVMKRLAEKLLQRGIEVEQSHREGMMKRIWELRSYIDSTKEGREGHFPKDAISLLMSAEDILFRLDTLSSAFDQNPEGTVVAELHAMNANVFTSVYGAQYYLEEGFEKVPDAHALSMGDPFWHFADTLSFIREDYGCKGYHDSDFSGLFEKLKVRFGMALDNIVEEAKGLLEKLSSHRWKIRLFEFPSFEEPLSKGHPAHPVLFRKPDTLRSISDFERTYGACLRHDACPDDSELEAVAEMFRARE
ncbi:hypothetical protein GF415_04485 [Candidatus Micrarchaeota archaeon]|nr:hypothetical protein [Candidatus Micrarchaeota archaeon]